MYCPSAMSLYITETSYNLFCARFRKVNGSTKGATSFYACPYTEIWETFKNHNPKQILNVMSNVMPPYLIKQKSSLFVLLKIVYQVLFLWCPYLCNFMLKFCKIWMLWFILSQSAYLYISIFQYGVYEIKSKCQIYNWSYQQVFF